METTGFNSASPMGSMRKLTAFELAGLPAEFNRKPLFFTFQREAARLYESCRMTVSDGKVTWDVKVLPDYPMFDTFTSSIHIRVYEPRGLSKRKLLLRLDESVKPSTDYSTFTQRRPIFGQARGYVSVRMESQDVDDEIAVDSARDRGVGIGGPSRVEALRKLAESGKELVEKAEDADDNVSELGIDVGSELSSVLSGLLGVWEKLQDLSEIHPYLNVAYKAVNFAYSQYKDQLARDEKVRSLSKTMSKVYDFLEHADQLDDTEHLKDNEARKEILREITGQTRECIYFIIDYAQQRNFWLRLLDFNKGGADDRVEEFNATFTDLQEQFMESAELQGAIIAAELVQDIRKLPFSYHWNFEWVRDAGFDKSKRCLRGTSRSTLQTINDWINGNTGSKVFLLTGEAGTGKSAIAHTIAGRCHDDGKLGASFFFNRNLRDRSEPKKVFPTLGHHLTEHNSDIRSALMEQNSTLNKVMSLSEQFDTFLLKPCARAEGGRIIVIIVDAVDESGTQEERRELLGILARKTNDLPTNFRVLVTARSDPDINQAFENVTGISKLHLRPDKTLKEDIRKYFRFELWEEKRYPGIDKRSCDALAERSEGLWQWASSACLYITTDPEDPVANARNRFHSLMNHTAESSVGGRFYVLYQFILDEVNPDLEDFKEVMNFLFALTEPLPLSSITKLLDISGVPDTRRPPIEDILPYLGSLFSGVRPESSESEAIEPLHASVREFLEQRVVQMDDSIERVNRFHVFVQLSIPHSLLAYASIRVLNEQLGFNMAKLATSYRRNRDVKDLESRLKDVVTKELSYACRFWALHLKEGGSEEATTVLEQVDILFKENILFWLEALSLLGAINLAAPALSAAQTWTVSHDSGIARFINDTRTFVRKFAGVMAESSPHIYLSALMNAPSDSMLFKQYSPRFPSTFRFLTGQSLKWPTQELALDTVFCHTVTFSPDDRRIIAGLGSNVKNVVVYDAETGETVLPPFDGHKSFVNGVAVSSDGSLVASGSEDKTVRIWGATTGKSIGGPFKGHLASVTSVAFSPDNKTVVSSSEDRSLIIWDIASGAVIATLKGHAAEVQCVVWLPNGTTIASGGKDATVMLWDVPTKKKSKTLVGHSDEVNAICASRTTPALFSASNDSTVRVWDSGTGSLLGDPIQTKAGQVTALDLSRDEAILVTGHSTTEIFVWNTQTRERLFGPIRGHASNVGCVSLSSDGSRIVSAADFDKVRTFDVYGAAGDIDPPDLLDGVMAVDYTPEAQRIVTGHREGNFQVWDVTGTPTLRASKNAGDSALQHIAISADGKWAASTAFNNNTVRIWDVERCKPLGKRIADQGFSIDSLQFSQDSKRLAVGSWDGSFYVWDLQKRAISLNPVYASSRVQTLAFSYNGEWIVTGHWACNLRIWNSQTGQKLIDTLKDLDTKIKQSRESGKGDRNPIDCIACSRGNDLIVSGSWDHLIRRWDPRTGDVIGDPLAGHSSIVNTLDISPDGTQILSGSADKTIRIWDAKTGEQIRMFESHADTVFYVRYGLSSDQFVSASYNGTIRTWDLSDLKLDQSPFSPNPKHNPASRYATGPLAKGDASLTSRKGWILPATHAPPTEEDDAALTAEQDLLFWLPESHLRRLHSPGVRHVMAEGAVMLDLSSFAHGERWHECISASFVAGEVNPAGTDATSPMEDDATNIEDQGEQAPKAVIGVPTHQPQILAAVQGEEEHADAEDHDEDDADEEEDEGSEDGDEDEDEDDDDDDDEDDGEDDGEDGNGDGNGASDDDDDDDDAEWVDEDGSNGPPIPQDSDALSSGED